MRGLALQRCGNHPDREAAARCPQCRNYFCRECVTEHDGRMICSRCLENTAATGRNAGRLGVRVLLLLRAGLGLFLVWLCFYTIGRTMLLIPSEFHEGTLWQGAWWENE